MKKSLAGAGWVFGLVALGGLTLWTTPRLESFLKTDTLAPYKKKPDVGAPLMKMGEAEIQLYHIDKLVGQATVSEISVDKNRSTILMRGIQKGESFSDGQPRFSYTAERGTWEKAMGELSCDGRIVVKNADFNLNTSTLKFRQADQELHIPNDIQGKFFGGDLVAKNLRYRLKSKAYTVGPVVWTGPLQDKAINPKKTVWKFSAPGGGSSPDGVTVTYKTASATDGEIIVKADTIVSNRDTGVMVATGNVKYFGKDVNMSCPKATVYRKERRVVLEGNVSLLIKAQEDAQLKEVEFEPLRPVVPESIAATRPPDPTGQLDKEVTNPANKRKYPVRVLAQRIEFWYREGAKRAVITGSPQARQDLPGGRWRQIWATKGLYDGQTDRLRLESGTEPVRMRSSRGDDLRTSWFEVSTKDGDESWKSGKVEGEIIEEEEIEETAPVTPPGT